MASSSVNNKKGPLIDPGQCRCCGASKKCRLLNVEYQWMGVKEVYSEMFVDTFGLLLSHLDGEPSERAICATCVSRLRDASAFRRQVLVWEQTLLESSILLHYNDSTTEIKQESDNTETEKEDTSQPIIDQPHTNHFDGDDDDMCQDYTVCAEGTAQDKDQENPILIKSEPEKTLESKESEKIKKSEKNLKAGKKKTAKIKKKSRDKKSKEGKRRKEISAEERARQEVLERMRLMEEKLEELHQLDEEELPPKPTRPRVDPDLRYLHNTCTIVENSYVCPFDTSFSDYFCFYCRSVFTDPHKLREHTLSHDVKEFKTACANKKLIQLDVFKIDCRLCLERIDNIDVLKEHLIKNHGKSFYDIKNEFLKFKLTSTCLTCLECGSNFSFFHALKKHMAEHFGTCICDICGAHYFEERMLLLHQKAHKKVEEIFPCKDCGKTFKSKHSRNLHETRTHKKEPAYQCPKCDSIFFTYTLRYRHMIETHGEERLFQCEHCERAYDSRKSLREHNRRFHLKIFKHQCDLCEKRFYLPSRLKEHLATHTGERNFRCEYCGKSYPRLRGLKVHMQSHSSDKKYRCALCNASFTQNVNLKNHIKRQHQALDIDEGGFNE